MNATFFRGTASPELIQTMRDNGVRCIVNIGRRQPFHRVHLDCVTEIEQAGFPQLLVQGSVNEPSNPAYNPLKNPFTYSQSKTQIERA